MIRAVTVRHMTRSQAVEYFARVGVDGGGGVSALQDDEVWKLFTSPLMLNIVALAYGTQPLGGLTDGSDVVEWRRHLFDAYVVEMLSRRGAPHARYTAEEIVYALKVLATASIRLDVGVAIRRPSLSAWTDCH